MNICDRVSLIQIVLINFQFQFHAKCLCAVKFLSMLSFLVKDILLEICKETKWNIYNAKIETRNWAFY